MTSLRARNLQAELMDSADLDAERFVGSLEGLRRVNRATGSARILFPLLAKAAEGQANRPLRVLDVACGGGDVAVALWKRLTSRGFQVEIEGCDINSLAVQHAGDRAERVGANVSFFRLDALVDPIPEGYDVVMSSLYCGCC